MKVLGPAVDNFVVSVVMCEGYAIISLNIGSIALVQLRVKQDAVFDLLLLASLSWRRKDWASVGGRGTYFFERD